MPSQSINVSFFFVEQVVKGFVYCLMYTCLHFQECILLNRQMISQDGSSKSQLKVIAQTLVKETTDLTYSSCKRLVS